MSKIKVLPDLLANKIAAGEVVERPASVVKELLENSLDAGARKIQIEIESGGKRLIRIVDDGEGMTRDDAILAFERHATSKLRSVEDLETISTLGFRGEALPSIAAVSRLFLRTKTQADLEGTEIEFNGGRLVDVRDVAWPGGTEIEAKELFFNIPARRKFLKSDATESFHITNLVQHYALANPALSFLLVSNGRDAIRVEPARSLKERAYQILGGALLNKLVEVESEAGDMKVFGFVSNPQEQRSSRDMQYLFINNRFVRDQLVGRALSEAYRSMMPSGTHPAAVLFINVPAPDVDVNVHPAKTQVRFLRESAVIAFVRDAVANALKATQPITRIPHATREAEPWSRASTRPPAIYSNSTAPSVDMASRPQARPPFAGAPAQSGTPEPEPYGDEAVSSDFSMPGDVVSAMEIKDPPVTARSDAYQDEPSEFVSAGEEAVSLPGLGHGIKPLGQIRDSYIAATDEEGLLLVDQHAAHERVLFEQIRDTRLSRPANVQPLLIPETLDLTPAETAAFSEVQAELESVGIETMELSGRTIAIKTAPAGLAAGDVVTLVRELLGVIERERRSFSIESIRDQIAASLACKAAIKVNMPLTNEKMQWLIDELMKTANPMTCPHGRPIIMRMDLREIERGFKRPV
ncbi:MAG TPA: DNA mismatch repair endonuclease MutL [Blastocatellia bacterium]|jgi:DNA mismatch repair protein MutL